jgi:Ser/Thr protein kinase RdoA (MazF antagonist)
VTDVELRPTHLLDELARNGALRTTGLYLTDPNLTYDQLEAVGGLLGRMHQSLRFAIGDWLRLMEERFPAKFSQAAEVLGISEEGMREYLRVSEKVPRSIRREKLSWSHHRAVAALEVPEQKEWLKRAEAEQLSHHQLRDRLRVDEEPNLEPASCRCCHRPL